MKRTGTGSRRLLERIGERLRQLLAQDLDRVYLVASDLTVKQQR